jgi:hypothetical protein
MQSFIKSLIVVAALLAVSCQHDTNRKRGIFSSTISVHPIHIEFDAPEMVLMVPSSDEIERTVEIVRRNFLKTEPTVLNEVREYRLAKQAPKGLGDHGSRTSGKFLMNKQIPLIMPFKEEKVTIEDLKASTTQAKLETLLGWPQFSCGAFDTRGTFVWQWRTCNGYADNRFEGLEITAALRWSDGTVDFLILRQAKPAKRNNSIRNPI